MRLLHLTAGAADMYCGSCLRDNALATALINRGHDVVLMPIYTPTTTDEKNVSDSHVFFGGVSVFLEQHVPLFRHTPAFLDRLWDSNAALRLASKRQIKVDPAALGSMTVSMLKGADGYQAKEVDKLRRWLEHVPRFDVVSLPFTLLIGLARPLRAALNVPVTCTLQGEDLFLNNLPEPYRTEAIGLIRAAVPHVDRFLSVSEAYVPFMRDFLKIPESKMAVVPLGITMDGHDVTPTRVSPPFTIGYFGRIAPEKGLHLLAEAYRRLRQRPDVPDTRLLAGGYLLNEHRPYFDGVVSSLRQAGLGDQFEYAGAPNREGKIALFHRMDVMSMPATYDEPKGLTLLEAMANGVPVVQPDRGAFTEIVQNTGGGLLVAKDDPEALADGLLALLTDRGRAAELARAGADAVRRQYTVDHMAQATERAYATLRPAGSLSST
ncbi:MAG TPA: glycosyltransferase family 4 protein [Vicinamibacterales bacterium]|nr:glycosyltransferase family 4 protein [Vicinamibacterales bacterium]